MLALSAGLVADVWNPPFHANVTGVIRRIRTVAHERIERDGVLIPAGPWALEDVDRSPIGLETAKPGDDPGLLREDGLLVNLAITKNEILRLRLTRLRGQHVVERRGSFRFFGTS